MGRIFTLLLLSSFIVLANCRPQQQELQQILQLLQQLSLQQQQQPEQQQQQPEQQQLPQQQQQQPEQQQLPQQQQQQQQPEQQQQPLQLQPEQQQQPLQEQPQQPSPSIPTVPENNNQTQLRPFSVVPLNSLTPEQLKGFRLIPITLPTPSTPTTQPPATTQTPVNPASGSIFVVFLSGNQTQTTTPLHLVDFGIQEPSDNQISGGYGNSQQSYRPQQRFGQRNIRIRGQNIPVPTF